jgi:hypothetical protein
MAASPEEPTMSANPPTQNPADEIEVREYTKEEERAMFASVVWLDDQINAGKMAEYAGKYVAVLGESILDADPNADELMRRVLALGNSIPQYRVVARYLPGWEDNY